MKPIVVCGLHRSGTTFVGEIIRRSGKCVLHEPLNVRHGIEGVQVVYPYVLDCSDRFAELIDDVINFSRPWNKSTDFIKSSVPHRIIYSFTGGRSGLKWGVLRLKRAIGIPHRQVCIKDPFMSLATPYIAQYHDLNTVCIVRHPAAIYYSCVKKKWRFDIDNLLQQKQLLKSFDDIVCSKNWRLARSNPAASLAILWKIMIRINKPLARTNKRLLMIKHEDLCADSIGVGKEILEHFEIPFTQSISDFIASRSSGTRIEAKSGKTHDFIRNSQRIPEIWKGKLKSTDENVIFQIAGDEITEIYGG